MTFNIITPLNRYENLPELIHDLEDRHTPLAEIRWHVITDRDCPFGIYFKQPWIEHYVSPNNEVGFWQRCNNAINWFLSSFKLNPEEYYCFMNDDDGYEPDFFDKLDRVASNDNPDVIIVSMKRGNRTPPGVAPERAHGTSTLIAAAENMKPGHVGIEQIVVKGRVLAPCRLPMNVCGDGMMIEWIVSDSDSKYVRYVPEIYAHFNELEPGRWD